MIIGTILGVPLFVGGIMLLQAIAEKGVKVSIRALQGKE